LLNLVSKIDTSGPLVYQPSYQARERDSGLTLKIQLTSATTFKVDQEIVTRYLGWKPGEPKNSFPELLQDAKGLEYLQLDDLQKTLTNNASKGTETFEAFGITLPAGQITVTGILLILAIQLSLMICFAQRSPEIPCDDLYGIFPGSEWIRRYSGEWFSLRVWRSRQPPSWRWESTRFFTALRMVRIGPGKSGHSPATTRRSLSAQFCLFWL
jgi:hypothetical protein